MDGAALPEKLTHDQLARDLATHLRGASSRVTWEDMQLGPSGSPRPDVYTMEPTYTRLTFEAFEVKVSVADFRRDVTAGKWQSYLKYANAVTFAAPLGLVTKEMVPPTCGLILRGPTGQWRYAKKPTRTVLTEMPWQAWIKLLLDGVQRTGREQRERYFSSYSANQKLAKKFGADVASQLSDLESLPRLAEYARKQHNEDLARLKAQYAETAEQLKLMRDRDRDKCSGTLGRLAVAMGLPADALLSELHPRAAQLLEVLQANGSRYGNTLDGLTRQLETTLTSLKDASAILRGSSPTEAAND